MTDGATTDWLVTVFCHDLTDETPMVRTRQWWPKADNMNARARDAQNVRESDCYLTQWQSLGEALAYDSASNCGRDEYATALHSQWRAPGRRQ